MREEVARKPQFDNLYDQLVYDRQSKIASDKAMTKSQRMADEHDAKRQGSGKGAAAAKFRFSPIVGMEPLLAAGGPEALLNALASRFTGGGSSSRSGFGGPDIGEVAALGSSKSNFMDEYRASKAGRSRGGRQAARYGRSSGDRVEVNAADKIRREREGDRLYAKGQARNREEAMFMAQLQERMFQQRLNALRGMVGGLPKQRTATTQQIVDNAGGYVPKTLKSTESIDYTDLFSRLLG